MHIFTISAVWAALLAITASSEAISARQTAPNIISLQYIVITQNGQLYTYPFYNVTVPVDGSTVPIGTTEIIYSIFSSEAESVDCTLLGVDGQITHIETEQIDADGPQQFVAVTCCPADNGACPAPVVPSSSSSAVISSSTASSSLSAASITPSAVGTGVSSYPLYPTGTGAPYGVIGAAGTAASTGLSPVASGTGVVYKGTGTPVPFTGDAAVRSVRSIGGSLVAFAGLVFAL